MDAVLTAAWLRASPVRWAAASSVGKERLHLGAPENQSILAVCLFVNSKQDDLVSETGLCLYVSRCFGASRAVGVSCTPTTGSTVVQPLGEQSRMRGTDKKRAGPAEGRAWCPGDPT